MPLCRLSNNPSPSPVHPRPSLRGLGPGLDGPALASARAAAGCLAPGKPGDTSGCLPRRCDGARHVPQKELSHA